MFVVGGLVLGFRRGRRGRRRVRHIILVPWILDILNFGGRVLGGESFLMILLANCGGFR